MIRLLIIATTAVLIAVLFTGCASVDTVACALPEPPRELLIVPKPLPPIPADLTSKP